MPVHYLKYLLAYIVPLSVLLSIYLGGYWSYAALVLLFGLLPVLELLTKEDKKNLVALEESIAAADRFYDFLLFGLVPFQLFVLAYFLHRVGEEGLFLHERIGMITAYGMACGLSINNAHELGHRKTKYEQGLSKLLLWTTLYMHFFIEHNRGHHNHVATDEDSASSRYGENVYAFFLRTLWGSWISAWKLENKRLVKEGKNQWTIENEMLRFLMLQLLLISSIGLYFGWIVLGCFILGASIGILMLETVNYIEHYGLRRKKNGKRYERTLPIHSWNSNHPIGRLILLELSRHSDHHFASNRKYQTLRHFDESPQMPTGYPGMMLLALVPPLWFNVMNKKIAHFKASSEGINLA